jgi:TonB family protein
VAETGNVDLLKGASNKIQNLLGNVGQNLGKGGSKIAGFGGFNTQGLGGQALSGTGTGGGGSADTLAGGLGKQGVGGGRVGTGLGASGTGNGIVGGKTRVVIARGGPEESVVMGAIDKDAIIAALEAHRDEFRLCYEKEINAESPDLGGTIVPNFVIGPSGRVTQAGIDSATLKNENVQACVIRVIKRIDFPQPRGGGVVQVTYPFKFRSTGSR